MCLAFPWLLLETVVRNSPLGRFGVLEEVTAQEGGRGTRGPVSVAPFKSTGLSHPRVSLLDPSLCGAVGRLMLGSVRSLQSLVPCSLSPHLLSLFQKLELGESCLRTKRVSATETCSDSPEKRQKL